MFLNKKPKKDKINQWNCKAENSRENKWSQNLVLQNINKINKLLITLTKEKMKRKKLLILGIKGVGLHHWLHKNQHDNKGLLQTNVCT